MNPLYILSTNFNLLATLMFMAFAVKIIPSLIFVPSFGLMNSLRIGIIQTSKLSLTIAGVSIGKDLGVFSYDEAATVIFFTILTCLISPSIFKALDGGSKE
jgi:Kef-type K+ transport system membrane component KefB